MKNTILLSAIAGTILAIASCKTKSNCDAYTQGLKLKLDSMTTELSMKSDSLANMSAQIQFLEDTSQVYGKLIEKKKDLKRIKAYVKLLEDDNQYLGSALAAIEMEAKQ